MTRLLKGISYFIYRYHKHILIASIISAVLSILLILQIEIKTDIMDVLPADNPSMNLFAETMNDFGRMDALTVVLESRDSDIVEHIGVIDALGRRLSESPLIKDVSYNVLNVPWNFMLKYFPLYLDEQGLNMLKKQLTAEGIMRQIRHNYRTLVSPFSSIADIKMISDDPLNIRSILISKIAEGGNSGMDFSTGYYLSKDHSLALMFVTPDGSSRNITFVKSLKKDLDAIVEESLKISGNPDDLDIGFTGIYAVSWETQESMQYDMLSSALITIILVLVIFRFIYRGRLIAIPVIFLTLFMAILYTLTIAYMLFGGLNLITAVVSAMLIGLGIDYTLHIYDRYIMELMRHKDARLALKSTLINTGKSVITSGITTAFAFFSIVVTGFRGLHELGIVAGIGIISCMLSTIFIMGSMLIWISSKHKNSILGHGSNSFLEQTIPDFITRNGKLFLITLGAVILFAIFGIGKLKFISDVSQIGLRNSSAMNIQKRLSDKFAEKKNPLIVTYHGSKNIDEAFNELEKRLNRWKDNGITGGHTSLGSLIPPRYKQKIAMEKLQDINKEKINIEESFISALNKYGFNVTDKNISYIRGINNAIKVNKHVELNELLESGNKKVRFFYNKDKNRLAAYIYPEDNQWSQSNIETIKKDFKSMGNGWHVTGWQLLSGELKDSIVKESIIAAFISFGFIFTIIYFHFKRGVIIFLAQIPLLSGFIITLGIMGYANIGFNYINVAAIAMLFGISVDYGVYIMQAFLENKHLYDKGIIRHAFKNIVICSLTTMAGFGSLVTTNFRGIASLGLVIMIGVISCLIISTALLPIAESFLKARNEGL